MLAHASTEVDGGSCSAESRFLFAVSELRQRKCEKKGNSKEKLDYTINLGLFSYKCFVCHPTMCMKFEREPSPKIFSYS